MRNTDKNHRGNCAVTLLIACALLIALASSSKAGEKSDLEKFLEGQQEKIFKSTDEGSTFTLGPVTTTEDDAAAARQRKNDAIESLNKTLKDNDDRVIARELQDGGVGVISR